MISHLISIRINMHLVLLALIGLAIGGVLGISLLKYYFPSPEETNINHSLFATPDQEFGND